MQGGARVVAARQSTNGIFDGGRSVIHGSLRGHCIRSAGVALSCNRPGKLCPPRGLIDAASVERKKRRR